MTQLPEFKSPGSSTGSGSTSASTASSTSNISSSASFSSSSACLKSKSVSFEAPLPSPGSLFYVMCAAVRIFFALTIPVMDCDETYNYTEPAHMLLYNRGFQTWEYSPEYGLRSYIYIVFLWLLAQGARITTLPMVHVLQYLVNSTICVDKMVEFYSIRVFMALLFFICEVKFQRAVQSILPRYSKLSPYCLPLLMTFSSGMAHNSVSMLPQTFTTATLMLSVSYWMTAEPFGCIFFMAVSALIGWPFVAVMAVPMGLDLVFQVCYRASSQSAEHEVNMKVHAGLTTLVKYGVIAAGACLIPTLMIDYFFYRKWFLAVVNIALYNARPENALGSQLYGVEPVSMYISNLFLNFNVAFLCAAVYPLLAGIVVCISCKTAAQATVPHVVSTTLKYASPLFVWLGCIFPQPHKEERFLYVVYPLLCFVAALSVDILMHFVHQVATRCCGSVHRRTFTRGVFWSFLLVFLALSVARTTSLIANYRSPTYVYGHLNQHFAHDVQMHAEEWAQHTPLYSFLHEVDNTAETTSRVVEVRMCVGKEWYRFPSHFFVPELTRLAATATTAFRVRVDFLDEGFGGILPKHYDQTFRRGQQQPGAEGIGLSSSSSPSFSIATATSMIPTDMNALNQREPSRFVAPASCFYIVDWEQEAPPLGSIQAAMDIVYADPFLDATQSAPFYRSFSVPFMSQQKNIYKPYVLRRRREAPSGSTTPTV